MRTKSIGWLLSIILLAGCNIPTGQDSELSNTADLIIENVTVLTMSDEGEILLAQIVIDAGRISSINTGADIVEISADTRIDGTGKYLMPGLIDAHTHILTPFDLPLYPAAGVTTVRNMWGFPMHIEMRKRISAGTMFGPKIITAGRLIDGEPKIWPQSISPQTREEIEEVITQDQQAGYDFVKIYSHLSPEQFYDVLDVANELGMIVVGHVPNKISFKQAAQSGLKSFEHLWEMPGALQADKAYVEYDPFDRTQWESIDFEKIDGVAAIAKENDVWITPTLMVLEYIYLAGSPELLASQARGLQYVNPGTIEYWKAGATGRPEVTEDYKAWVDSVLKTRGAIVKRLYENGVNLLVGTDANNAFVVHGFAIVDEMQKFVDAGIPPIAVLKIATADAATFLGKSDDIGTVAVGKEADLILLNKDPRQSIEHLSDQVGVIIDGRYHSKSELVKGLIANRAMAVRALGAGGN